MKCLLFPLIITFTLIFSHILMNRFMRWWGYIIFFFVVFLANILFTNNVDAAFIPNASIEINSILLKKLSSSDQKYYQEKRDFHKKEGERTFNDAKSRCMWIPYQTDREVAKNCFITAVSAISSGTPQSKAVSMLMVSLTQYGLNVLCEYEAIETKLNWSKYHFEMYDFYNELLGT